MTASHQRRHVESRPAHTRLPAAGPEGVESPITHRKGCSLLSLWVQHGVSGSAPATAAGRGRASWRGASPEEPQRL